MKCVSWLGLASRGATLPRAPWTRAFSYSTETELTVGATAGSSVERIISSSMKRRGLADLKVSPENWYTLLQASQSSPTTSVVSMGPRNTLGELFHFSSVISSPSLLRKSKDRCQRVARTRTQLHSGARRQVGVPVQGLDDFGPPIAGYLAEVDKGRLQLDLGWITR